MNKSVEMLQRKNINEKMKLFIRIAQYQNLDIIGDY